MKTEPFNEKHVQKLHDHGNDNFSISHYHNQPIK
jgi:hypothetical protein